MKACVGASLMQMMQAGGAVAAELAAGGGVAAEPPIQAAVLASVLSLGVAAAAAV